MSFDFATLITDRQKSDADYARALIGRITDGTATAEELAAWNAATLKGVYDYTDLNRVTAAMDEINTQLSAAGYKTGYSWGEEDYSYSPNPSIPQAELQLIETVYINGSPVVAVVGYDNVNTAIEQAAKLPVPKLSTTRVSFQTKFAIDPNTGLETTTRAYSNFNVYSNKENALSFKQSAVANGGAEKSFEGVSEGYYLMIATENYGAVTYYAYLFSDKKKPNPTPIWYEDDSPTLVQINQYLANVRALRATIANLSPEVPEAKDMFSVEAANNIEKILLAIERAIQTMKQTYVPCGATACGGDYL